MLIIIVFDDLPEVGQCEVQVTEPRILARGLLRGHGRQEREEDRGVHPKSAQGRSGGRSADDPLRRRPVQRVASDRCGRWSVPAAALSGSWYQRAMLPENAKPPDYPVDNYSVIAYNHSHEQLRIF